MANEKKPSIYADRGTIGSYDELDEYGVWVKSEPQELSLAGVDVADDFGDFSLDDSAATVDFSTDESADMLGLEIPDISDIPDIDNLPDLDNFQEDFDNPALKTELVMSDMDDGQSDNTGPAFNDDDFDEISMDDLIVPLDTEMDAPPDDEELAYSNFSVSDADLGDSDFIALTEDDSFGDVASGQNEAGYASSDLSDEILSVAQDSSTASAGVNLSTQLLMKIADELSSIRSELSNLKREFSSVSSAPAPSREDETIALTGDELSDILSASPASSLPSPPLPEVAEDDFLTNEEDEKISLTGDELSNILNTADFTEEAGADTAEDALSDEEIPGFSPVDLDMDSELDMSIPSDEVQLEEFDIGLDAMEFEDVAISEPEFEILPEEMLSEEVFSEELLSSEESLPDFAIGEMAELDEILKNGVEPVTPAPDLDDSEYLSLDHMSSDTLSEDIVSEESIDLSNAVIDEPDFSADIQDISIEEPLLQDIGIDLDMEGEISLSEDPLVEQTFDLSDISADISEEEMQFPSDSSGDTSFETFDAKSSGDGGDLSLIPEGLVVGSETDSLLESDSIDFNPAEFDTTELGDFVDEPALPQEAELDAPGTSGEDETFSMDDMDDIDNFLTDSSDMMSGDLPEAISEKIPEDLPMDISDDMDMLGDVLEIQDGIPAISGTSPESSSGEIPSHLKHELRTVLTYMDQLLEALPDDKIEEFAKSEYYDTYKKLFRELGLV
jgi:hypothetical protein